MRVKRAAHLPGPYGGYEKKTHFQPFFLRTASLCRRSRARRFVAYFDSLAITQNGANGSNHEEAPRGHIGRLRGAVGRR